MPARRKKKYIRQIILYTALIVLVAFGGWFGNKWLKYRRAKFTHYAQFGIAIPGDYTIHGIDVSKYQDIIAWEEVKAMKVSDIQIGFAFIKATEGIDNTDPQFRRNWRK